MNRSLLLVACPCLLCLYSPLYADYVPIPNGGFESGATGWTMYASGGASWAVVNQLSVPGFDPIMPHEGSSFLQFSMPSFGFVNAWSSNVALQAGQTIGGVYQTVSGGGGGGGSYNGEIEVARGTVALYDLRLTGFGSPSGWTAWSFTAPMAETVQVEYILQGTPAEGGDYILFDSDLGTSVPEPTCLVLGLGTLAALGGAKLRRRP
jgi:hypothetical protein